MPEDSQPATPLRTSIQEGELKYLCLVYNDQKKLDSLTPSEYDALVAEIIAYDEDIRQSGHCATSNALEFVATATSIRVRGDNIAISDGPFVESKEQLAGYVLIEARDLNEAIRIVARMPPARMGGVEVRPVRDISPGHDGRRA